ncbi:short chain dehydrogenase [Diaporthe eres]|uniref:Short chain dehydrogenase n=1 Tax=Diaporthe vaccinii TaxID=105482 RepID=A0ABR4E909_9PEZI|nr:short chain dehydrogenase [Diaporthe eres]
MATYVITGVSRGLGWEFLNQISSNPDNTVVGIVRNKSSTDKRVAEELSGRSNITILEADLTSYGAVKKAAENSIAATGGKVDYIIANAGYVPTWDMWDGLDVLGEKHVELEEQFTTLLRTNVIGNIYLFNSFMPQVLKSKVKKVATISSGMGDMDFVKDYDISMAPLYSASKAAMNMIAAKFSAHFKKDGVLFLSICPGMVDVGHFETVTPEQQPALESTLEKFKRYSPTFSGPDTPPESIKAVLSVINNSSIENGAAGAYLSHFGNKRWV